MNETLVSCVRCVRREKNGSHLNVSASVCSGDGQAALQLDPRRQRRKKKIILHINPEPSLASW